MKDTFTSENAPQLTEGLNPGLDSASVSRLTGTDASSRRTIDWGRAFHKLFTGCLILALGLILTYHFYLFWTVGSVVIEEPNKTILFFETAMSLAIIIFGLDILIRD